jgi:hypothetical protein
MRYLLKTVRHLVGLSNSQRVINWPGVLVAVLVVGAISSSSAAAVSFILTTTVDLGNVLFVACLMVILLRGSVRRAWASPVEKLPRLD